MTDDQRTHVSIALEEEEYAQLVADAAQRGISLQALLGEIVDAALRRWQQEERARH